MRKKSKARPAGSGPAAERAVAPPGMLRGLTRGRGLFAVVGIALLAAAVAWWWQISATERAFHAFVAEGKPALAHVQSLSSAGVGSHLRPGEPYRYGEEFPASGPHDPSWINPGFYASPQPMTRLVHSLEHGMIVVYADRLDAADRGQLEAWTKLYNGAWDGLVLVLRPGLGSRLVLTAWGKRLELDAFDARAAAAFIDAYRGRGPENRVR